MVPLGSICTNELSLSFVSRSSFLLQLERWESRDDAFAGSS